MFSLNPFSKNDSHRCTHLSSNNRQCRNLIPSTSDDRLCRFHSDQAKAAQLKAQQEAEEAALVAELYGQISDLDSPLAVAKVLSNLFRLIAEDRIPPKQASNLNSTARGILRALKDHEISQCRSADLPEDDTSAPDDADVAPHSSLHRERASDRTCAASFAASNPTSDSESNPASVAAGLARPGSGETSQSTLNEIPPHTGAAPYDSQGAGVEVDSSALNQSSQPKPSTQTKPVPPTSDQPCNTYKEALLATLRHSNMTPEEIDEYIKQHCDRLPYEPNSVKPKKPFVKFRPRRFRWSNSW